MKRKLGAGDGRASNAVLLTSNLCHCTRTSHLRLLTAVSNLNSGEDLQNACTPLPRLAGTGFKYNGVIGSSWSEPNVANTEGGGCRNVSKQRMPNRVGGADVGERDR